MKPFEMLELLVRLEKVMARQGKQEDCIRIRNVEIYPEKRVVKKDGEKVYLMPMEFDCLMLFVRNKIRR